MSRQSVSIVFRSLNEEKWFGEALAGCKRQQVDGVDVEIVVVDSGSTDATLTIAEEFGCRVIHIKKPDFTFGRSLNYGCEAATGDYLVFISAHCIPTHDRWLETLIAPLREGRVDYVYGRQIGHEVTRFSEHQVFAQYFPQYDKLPQQDFFVNNANAAIRRDLWAQYKFDEAVTGLEDMVLSKAMVKDGRKVGYVSEAEVIHIHEETYRQTRRRYYREALTLREIMPEVYFHFGDFLRYLSAGLLHDFSEALNQRCFWKTAPEIVMYRSMQFWGAYRGHNEHRVLSRAQKESYYYPRPDKADGRNQSSDTNAAANRKNAPAE